MVLIVLLFLFFMPLWSAITTSLKTGQEVALTTPLDPSFPFFVNPFRVAFDELDRSLINSFIFTTLATIFSSIIGSFAGYALTKLNISWSGKLFPFIVFGTFLPYQAILVPLVRIISNLGLYNSIWGLVLTHTAYGAPITTVLFANFYDQVPEELMDAARVDGAGIWSSYLRIILPLSTAGFVVTGIYQFTNIWNDYLFGLVLTLGAEAMPATVKLANLKGSFAANWNIQMAGAIIVALPTLLIYLLLGRQLMRGYTAGAVKG